LTEGSIQFEALQSAVRGIVRQEQVLRTTFHETGANGPEQTVLDFLEPAWEHTAIPQLEPDSVPGLLLSQRTVPFNPQNGPLLRVTLIDLRSGDSLLLLTLPAICADSLTLRNLLQRLSSVPVESPTFTPESDAYVEFAAWEEEMARAQGREGLLGRSFWNKQNLNAVSLPLTGLPSLSGAAGRWKADLGTALTTKLQQTATRLEVGASDFLRATWIALLARLTGDWDPLLVDVVDGRKYEEIGSALGPYARCLPLHIQAQRPQRLDDLARQIQKSRYLAIDWQEYATIPDELGFAFGFEWNDWSVSLNVLSFPAKLLGHYCCTEKLEVKLHALSLPDNVQLEIEVNSARLELGHAPCLGERYLRLLESALCNPCQQITELPAMAAAEEKEVLVGFNDTSTGILDVAGIHVLFEKQAQLTPEAPAVRFERHCLSYAELNSRANQVAHQLLALGLRTEQPVGILLERSAKTIVALLAVLKAGGAYVALDVTSPQERILLQLAESGAMLILTEPSISAALNMPSTVTPVFLDESSHFPESNPGLKIASEQLAYVLFTSGSTGKPKGVQIEHRQLINYMGAMQGRLNLPTGSSFAVVSTFAADLGNTAIYGALCSGGCLHVIAMETASDPESLRRYFRTHRIDCLKIVPSHIGALLSAAHPEQLLPEALLVLGGEVAPWTLVEKVKQAKPRCRILNHYGPTETTIGVLTFEATAGLSASSEAATTPLGTPLPNCRVYLLDEAMRAVPWGVTGEIYIGGEGLARGYLRDPETTAEKFVPDPFSTTGERLYRTGDLGRLTSDRVIEFLRRIDSQVKIHGYRIELGEIEATLLSHVFISQAVVLTREKNTNEKQLAAYVVPEGQAGVTGEELRAFLSSKLPSYMLPSSIVVLKAMPLNANGKVDRTALRDLDPQGSSRAAASVAPRTPQEETLAEIFKQVLGIPMPSIYDNYFELGGDSILAIQVVARANKQGLALSPKQIFECQTIAELAACCGRDVVVSTQEPVSGPVSLSPIQRWFFDQQFTAPHHWNQSMLLEVDQHISVSLLQKAIEGLVAHHDVLRSRFEQVGSAWTQSIVDIAEYPSSFTRVDLSHLSGAELGQTREMHMERVQADLHLSRGPVMRFVLFDHGPGRAGWLLIAGHHLVVDGVSWRILIEDLESACSQLLNNDPVRLPLKTHSWPLWTARLMEFAKSQSVMDGSAYWLQLADYSVPLLSRDSTGPNTVGSSDTVVLSLEQEPTRILLHKLPEVYGTQINDVLLTAVARAFARVTNRPRLLLDMEGHGRENISPDLDVSRTVGWFTTHYPVLLEVNVNETSSHSLIQVKQQLQAVPAKGIGFGAMRYLRTHDDFTGKLSQIPAREVKFNYLGQIDTTPSPSGLFSILRESVGAERDEFSQRTHLIDINAIVVSGQFHVRWTYSRNVHRRLTVQRLAEVFMEELHALIVGSGGGSVRTYSASDFPLARLNRDQFREIRSTVEASLKATTNGAQDAADVVDIYPLSPLQESLLGHCLAVSGSGVGFEQKCIYIQGGLDVQAFKRTWHEIVRQHAIFRTMFASYGHGGAVQVVLRDVLLPVETLDWRSLNNEGQSAELKTFLQQDRVRGFDPSRAPLMRLSLIQLAENNYEVVWSYHHLLLDAWSRNLVLKDVFEIYEGFRRGTPAQVSPSRPYRDYIEWLTRQDLDSAEKFWRELLYSIRQPTGFLGGPKLDLPPAADSDYQTYTFQLSEDDTAALDSFARQNRFTPNTLLQGAWSLLLGHLSGTSDVVYGTTTSGRPVTLPGVESILGMFINNVPIRVRNRARMRVLDWLAGLQSQLLEIRNHDWVSPHSFLEWSGIRGGQRLFESLLVFQNYPVSDQANAHNQTELSIRQISSRLETNYPITLVVGPFHPLTVRIVHDSRCFSGDTVRRWGACMIAILKSFAEAPGALLADVSLLRAEEARQVRQLSGNWTPETDSVSTHLDMRTKNRSDEIAVRCGAWTATWKQLQVQSGMVAARLRQLGAKSGDVIALVGAKNSEFAAAIMGIWQADGAVVICTGASRDELQSCLQQTKAEYALCFDAASPGLDSWRGTVVHINLSAETPYVPDPLLSPPVETLAWLQPAMEPNLWLAISHQALAQRAAALSRSLGGPQQNRLFITGPVASASLQLAEALIAGLSTVFVPDNAAVTNQELKVLLDESEANALRAPAHVWRALIEAGWRGGPDFVAFCCSPIVSKWLRRELAARTGKCIKLYSLDHISFHLAESPMAGSYAATLLGRPCANLEVWVLSEGLQPSPIGIYGEIYVSAACLGWSYWNSPEATAEHFLPHPLGGRPGMRLYRVGDIGRWNEDGNLEFGGVKRHSASISDSVKLTAAESALLCHPELREAAVATWKDSQGDQQAVAYIAADRKDLSGVEALSEEARMWLSRSSVPQMFVRLNQLPRDSQGRCRVEMLPAPDRVETRVEHVYAPPSDPIELRVKQIWEELFQVRPIGLRERFFELGGHSLLAVRLMTRIGHEFNRNLPVSLLLQGGTIEYLAQVIRTQSGQIPWSPLVQLQSGAGRPPLFCVHPMGGEVFCYVDLAHYLGPDQPAYGLQARAWGCAGEQETTVREMAASYLQAVKERQPQGPYFLAGWSFGGLVALEMAQQLVSAGEIIALLGIMDTDVKTHLETRLAEVEEGEPYMDWAKIILRFARPGAEIPEEELRRLDRVEDQVAHAIARGVLPPGLSVENAMCYVRASENNARAKNSYTALPYPGPITLFRAMQGHVLRCADPTLGWRNIALGGLQVVDVPGEHDVMVELPHVAELGRKVRECLDRASALPLNDAGAVLSS